MHRRVPARLSGRVSSAGVGEGGAASPARERGAGGSVFRLSPKRSPHRDGACAETGLPKLRFRNRSWGPPPEADVSAARGAASAPIPLLGFGAAARVRGSPVRPRPRFVHRNRRQAPRALCTGTEDNHPLCAPESKTIAAPAKAGALLPALAFGYPPGPSLLLTIARNRALAPSNRAPPLPSSIAHPPAYRPASLARSPPRALLLPSLVGHSPIPPSFCPPRDCTCGLELICPRGCVCVHVHSRARAHE